MVIPYRSTPLFDEATLPAALRSEHRTKAGVWGVTFLRVDEEGTEAAAATAVKIVVTSARIEPQGPEMVVDRPFLATLRDRKSGAVLFFGRIADGRVRQRGVISGVAPGCIDQAALGVICSGGTSSICGVARAAMPSICI
ncbi:serpin family protein [Sphingobium ummariense]